MLQNTTCIDKAIISLKNLTFDFILLVCSTASTQYWIWNIGAQPLPEKMWRPWTYNNQTAGYLTEFDLGQDNDSTFSFVTVHSAGHEVPAYKPAEALALFQSFLSGVWEMEKQGYSENI